MEISLTTPALLFPALSLLLLAYTNRFMGLADRVRNLKLRYLDTRHSPLKAQINNLRRRLILLRNMQAVGIASMFGCVLTMFVLYAGWLLAGKVLFGISLLLLLVSLGIALVEIQISVDALKIELTDIEDDVAQLARTTKPGPA
jgi:hypothetical protein